MDGTEDTEILLALLSSMIKGPLPSQERLLDELIKANGNAETAATRLNSSLVPQTSSNASRNKKRKRNTNLDSWIVNKKTGRKLPSSTNAARDLSPTKAKNDLSDGSSSAPIELNTADDDEAAQGQLPDMTKEVVQTPKKDMPPPVSLMSILKQAPSAPKEPHKFPPLTLSNPAMVSQHTPCTLHHTILPPKLACKLFYAMLREATSWSRNKWWLFDRLVESPHRTSFYAREIGSNKEAMKEEAQYWYNGRPTPPPNQFLPEMEEACEIIEKIVNEEIRKRPLMPLEWPSTTEHPWRANVAAANCYTGSKETVGFHSDQLTYLGPCPTIASLSLGTSRIFRLREVIPSSEKDERAAQTFNIPVVHNSLLIMHASCQERFKHCVPPQQSIDAFKPLFAPEDFMPTQSGDRDSHMDMMPPDTSRINITFRFYRPDFRASSIPRCNCGIPTILRPDMKNRQPASSNETSDSTTMRYFWMCYAGAQSEGKGCSFFQILDFDKEGRGVENMGNTQDGRPSNHVTGTSTSTQ